MVLKLKTRQVGLEESIGQATNNVNRKGISIKLRAADYTQPLGRITQKADEFTKSLEASNARVLAFGASAAIIGGVTRGFTELVQQAIKVEKILTDINVVLGTSVEKLEKFGQDLFAVAKNTSQGLEVAAEAALEFSRQGLGMEETLRRTNDALILTRLTGIDAASAVSGLTAAINGFADAGLTTTDIINKLAAVDVAFAVSAEDLINALARAGAVAQDAGVNFNELVGAVTSAQQITARGGAVIGNSFKTIFTRLQRSSTLERLEELGIATRDLAGGTLPAVRILQNLSTTYDGLADSTKAAVAEQVGGVFQINILKAALKDLNKENSLYAKATEISASATDQAQQKNAQLQKTLSSLAKQTSLSVQELAANVGELALTPGISDLLEAFNGLAEGLNNLLGSDAEGAGAEVAKGFVRGIGSVITGPGVVLAFGVFAKLFASALKFGRESLKDILGVVTQKDKERKIQESILTAMSTNVNLYKTLKTLSGDKKAQEDLIFKSIKAQTEQLIQQERIAKNLAPLLSKRGVQPDLTLNRNNPSLSTNKTTNSANGFIPNYSSVTPMEREKERGGALKAGYAPGAIKDMNIKGIGRVIYNNKETVKHFPGMSQPAIMPPSSSKAGSNYKDKFEKQHGFNPYVSNGFVPNYIDRSKIEILSKRGATKGERDAASNKLNQLDSKKTKTDSDSKKSKINLSLPKPSDRDFVSLYIKDGKASSYEEKSLHIDRLRRVSKYPEEKLKEISNARDHYQKNGKGSVVIDGTEVQNQGFVPNFAAKIKPGTNILELPQAKMDVETSVANNRGEKKTGLHALEAPLTSVKGKLTSYQKELSALSEIEPPPGGVGVLARNIMFTDYDNPKTRAERKDSAVGAAEKVAKTKPKKSIKGRAVKGVNKSAGNAYEDKLHEKYLDKEGYKKTSDQSKVDFIGKGLTPIEGKFGKFEQADLIAKSIRLYNDKSISNFLRNQGFTKDAQSLQKKNFEDSLLTIKQTGVDTDSMSLKEQVKLVKEYNLSDGFVPNFKSGTNRAISWAGAYERYKDLDFTGGNKQAIEAYSTNSNTFNAIAQGQRSISTKAFFSNDDEDLKIHWDANSGDKPSVEEKRKNIIKQFNRARAHDRFLKFPNWPELHQQFADEEFESQLQMAEAYGVKQNNFLSTLERAKKRESSKGLTAYQAWSILHDPVSADQGLKEIEQQWKDSASDKSKVIESSSAGRLFEQIIVEDSAGGSYAHGPDRIDIPHATFKQKPKFGIDGNYTRGDPIFHGFGNNKTGHVNFPAKIKAFIDKGEGGDVGGLGLKEEIIADLKAQINSTNIKNQFIDPKTKTPKTGRKVKGSTQLKDINLDITDMIGDYTEHRSGLQQAEGGKIIISKGDVDTKGFQFNIKDLTRDKNFISAYNKSTTTLSGAYNYNKDFLKLPQDPVEKRLKSPNKDTQSRAHVVFNQGAELGYYKSQAKQASTGFIPNFADPVKEAINRERSAGIPQSMIRLDQDNSLKSKNNPSGLAVINTRDEPGGVKQGINRAKKMGIDPKTHGASAGLIPNFASQNFTEHTTSNQKAGRDQSVFDQMNDRQTKKVTSKNFDLRLSKREKTLNKQLEANPDEERKNLLTQWQDKIDQAKRLSQSNKPRAQIDPVISQLNAEANKIWNQIQKLKQSKYPKNSFSGFIPNFAKLTLYRGQKRDTIDKPTIDKNMPSFIGVKTPEDVVRIIQDFVKSHVSGPMSGYRDIGEVDNVMPSGATSFSTSKTVAKNFAGSISPGQPITEGKVLSKTVPEKNVFNKKKLLKILNKGASPKRGHYPKVEEFKKAMASGAIQEWAQKNGGIYLNVSGRRNDPSLLKYHKTEYGRKEYDFYDKSMNQMVPHSDVGYNPNGTRQISPREQEVMQIFNQGLIPNFSRTKLSQGHANRREDPETQIRRALVKFNQINNTSLKNRGTNIIPLTPRTAPNIQRFISGEFFRPPEVSNETRVKALSSLKLRGKQYDFNALMKQNTISDFQKSVISKNQMISSGVNSLQVDPKSKNLDHLNVDLLNFDQSDPLLASSQNAAFRGIIPNYARRVSALYGSGYKEGTNGRSYLGQTMKNKKLFLTEPGYNQLKKDLPNQIPGINKGVFDNKTVYWVNGSQAQNQIKQWANEPNKNILATRQKNKDDFEKYKDELKNGKFVNTSAINQNVQLGYGAPMNWGRLFNSLNLSSKLGKEYEYISYNEKNIAEYAKKNKIYKESKKFGLQSSSKELDLEKAFSKILTLSKGSISSLNVIKPREKTDSEKKLAKEASDLEKIRWDVRGPKDFGLKASSRQSFIDFQNWLVNEKRLPSNVLDKALNARSNQDEKQKSQSDKVFKRMGVSKNKRETQARSDINYFKNDGNRISTDLININPKQLSQLVKEYNDSLNSFGGFVPNFASQNFIENVTSNQGIRREQSVFDDMNNRARKQVTSKNFKEPMSKKELELQKKLQAQGLSEEEILEQLKQQPDPKGRFDKVKSKNLKNAPKELDTKQAGVNSFGGFTPNFAAAANIALFGGLVGKNKFGNINRRQLSNLINSNPYFASLMKKHVTWDGFPKKEKNKLHRWLMKQGISNRALQAYGFASMHSNEIANTISDLSMYSGHIPNFSRGDALDQAISREKAAGIPESMIRLDQDESLKSKYNPSGLAVTNTKDEPYGVKQGIARAKKQGIDPKTHGASGGFVPNFMRQRGPSGKNTSGGASNFGGYDGAGKNLNVFVDALGRAAKATENFGTKATRAADNSNPENKASGESKKDDSNIRTGTGSNQSDQHKSKGSKEESANNSDTGGMGGVGKLMAITSVTYALQGAFSELEGETGKVMKGFAAGSQAISQYALISSSMKELAGSGGIGGVIGKLGPLGAVAGAIIPVFGYLKDNFEGFFDIVASSSEKMEKSLNKATKKVDDLGQALQAATSLEKTQNELTKINNSANSATFEMQMRKIKLEGQEIKEQKDLNKQVSALAKTMNLSQSEIDLMTSGTAEGMKALQEATLGAQRALAKISSFQDFQRSQGRPDGLIDALTGGGDGPNKIDKQLAVTSAANTFMGQKDSVKNIQTLLDEISKASTVTTSVTDARAAVKAFDSNEYAQSLQYGLGGAALSSSINAKRDIVASGQDATTFDKDSFVNSIAASDLPDDIKSLASEFAKMDNGAKDGKEFLEKIVVRLKELEVTEAKNAEQRAQTAELIAKGNDMLARANDLSRIRIREQKQAIELQSAIRAHYKEEDALQQEYGSILGSINAVQKARLKNQQDAAEAERKSEDRARSLEQDYENNVLQKFQELLSNKESPIINQSEGGSLFSANKGLTNKQAFKTEGAGSRIGEDLTQDLEGMSGVITANMVMAQMIQRINGQYSTQERIAFMQSQISNENLKLTTDQKNELRRFLDKEKDNLEDGLAHSRAIASEDSRNQGLRADLNNLKAGEVDATKQALAEMKKREKEIKSSTIEGLNAKNNLNEITEQQTQFELEALATTEGQLELIREIKDSKSKELDTENRRLMALAALQGNEELLAELSDEEVRLKMQAMGIARTQRRATIDSQEKLGFYDNQALDQVDGARDDLRERKNEVRARKANSGAFYANMASNKVENTKIDKREQVDQLTAERNVYAGEGNSLRTAELELEVAKARKVCNEELGRENLFRDTLAERIAESNIQLERLGETLANVSYDAVRDGFVQLVKDLGDVTKSSSEAFLGFAHSIVQKINDKLLEAAATKLTNAIFGMMPGMSNNYQGGLITGYASGGSVGGPRLLQHYSSGGSVGNKNKVPAMLTAGEYVVRKKIVDRLGPSTLDSVNESGSLEELFQKPNFDVTDVTSENAGGLPSIVNPASKQIFEGSLFRSNSSKGQEEHSANISLNQDESSTASANHFDQRGNSELYGFMKNSGISSLPGLVKKLEGGIVNLFKGGIVQKYKTGGEVASSPIPVQHFDQGGWIQRNQQHIQGAAEGIGYMGGSALYNYQKAKKNRKYEGPVAPENPNAKKLNASAALNLDPTGRDMSAMYRKNDSYSQQYGQYLLDKYQYDVEQKNAKTRQKAQMIGGIVTGLAGGFFMNQAADAVSGLKQAWHNRGMIGERMKMGKEDFYNNWESSEGWKKTQERYAARGIDLSGKNSQGQMDELSYRRMEMAIGGSDGFYAQTRRMQLAKGDHKTKLSDSTKYYNQKVADFSDMSSKSGGGCSGGSCSIGGNSISNSKTSNFFSGSSSGSSSGSMSTGYQNSHYQNLLNSYGSPTFDGASKGGMNQGGVVKPVKHFYQGGPVSSTSSVSSPVSNVTQKFSTGGQVTAAVPQKFSTGGKVFGPAGIDKVGPVLLDKGEYVIKASTVSNVEKQYPGFFDRLNSQKMNQGGVVQSTASPKSTTEENISNDNSSSNVTVNINVSAGGGEASVSGGDVSQQEFGNRIKDAVIGVISEQKRAGGMLS